MAVALTTYFGLLTTIGEWLNRQDLDDFTPRFVRMFEAKANRKLRTHDMVQRKTGVIDNGYFVVPDDWKETISFAYIGADGRPHPLEFVSIENSLTKRQEWVTGQPRFYTHVDSKFLLIPAPTEAQTFELIYRGAIPNLRATTDDDPGVETNWLLERSPDLYLYGSLAEAEPFLKNDERVAMWKAFAGEIFTDMQLEADRAAFPQGRLVAKARSF